MQHKGFTLTPTSLGRVNVITAGTAVQLSTTSKPCSHIRLSVVAGLTGKMYLGRKGFVAGSAMTGVIKEFAPNPSGGVDDSYDIQIGSDGNRLNLQDYWIDAAVSGEGLIVAYWTS